MSNRLPITMPTYICIHAGIIRYIICLLLVYTHTCAYLYKHMYACADTRNVRPNTT